MTKSAIRSELLRSKFNKTRSTKLSVLGNEYAVFMGYKFISNGIWELRGRNYTASHIGKTIAAIPKFIINGNKLNYNEIRRVNKGCPLNKAVQINAGFRL